VSGVRKGASIAQNKRVAKVTSRRPRESLVLTAGPITLNQAAMTVTKGGQTYKLTPKQAQLLAMFMRNPGKILERKMLVKDVWETDYLGDTRMLDVHIRWLREKIEDDPSHPVYLTTVRGVGYCFNVPPEEPGPAGSAKGGTPARGRQ